MLNEKYLNLLEQQGSLSLYIHIPFCNTKCYYCAFYSEERACWNDSKIDSYLVKLLEEIKIVKSKYNKPFDTVFIGGGNPGVLGYNNLRKLLIAIGPSKETTFEINPESLTDEYLNLFKEGLATRVSVGIQSFKDEILEMLGRHARKADNIKAMNIIKNLDDLIINTDENYFIINDIIKIEEFKKLNTEIKYSFDFMTSLPTQTLNDTIEDLYLAASNLDFLHFSLYCLTVEEGTHLYNLVKNKRVKKNDDLFEKDLLETLWSELIELGFYHYEVSNFTRHENHCLHNLKYWDLSPYIGLGSSAASTIYENNKLIRITNTSSFDEYIKSNLFDDYEVENLNKKEHLEEYLIVGLRNKRGINFNYIYEYFSIKKEDVIKAFRSLDKELYEINNDSINISEKGFIILDQIILDISIDLDKYLN